MESEHERKRREFYLEMSDAAFEEECQQLREDLKGFKEVKEHAGRHP